MKTLLALIAFTNPAWAACDAGERLFMGCTFDNGKVVEVCMTDEVARYTFGRQGQTPELALSLRFGEGAEFVPWPGIGRTIWEAVRIANNDVIYEVYGGFDKQESVEWDPETEISPTFGGIYIEDLKGVELAHLQCTPGTVDYGY